MADFRETVLAAGDLVRDLLTDGGLPGDLADALVIGDLTGVLLTEGDLKDLLFIGDPEGVLFTEFNGDDLVGVLFTRGKEADLTGVLLPTGENGRAGDSFPEDELATFLSWDGLKVEDFVGDLISVTEAVCNSLFTLAETFNCPAGVSLLVDGTSDDTFLRNDLPILLPLDEVSLDEPFSHDESVWDSFLEASLDDVRTGVPLLEARLVVSSVNDELERVALAGELFLGSFFNSDVLSFFVRGEAKPIGVFLRELFFGHAGSSGIWGCLSSEDEAVLDLRLRNGITSMLPVLSDELDATDFLLLLLLGENGADNNSCFKSCFFKVMLRRVLYTGAESSFEVSAFSFCRSGDEYLILLILTISVGLSSEAIIASDDLLFLLVFTGEYLLSESKFKLVSCVLTLATSLDSFTTEVSLSASISGAA